MNVLTHTQKVIELYYLLGAAMQYLHDEMAKRKDKDFLTVGKFSKTHGQAAEMYTLFIIYYVY